MYPRRNPRGGEAAGGQPHPGEDEEEAQYHHGPQRRGQAARGRLPARPTGGLHAALQIGLRHLQAGAGQGSGDEGFRVSTRIDSISSSVLPVREFTSIVASVISGIFKNCRLFDSRFFFML